MQIMEECVQTGRRRSEKHYSTRGLRNDSFPQRCLHDAYRLSIAVTMEQPRHSSLEP